MAPLPKTMKVVNIRDGKGPLSHLYIDDTYAFPDPAAVQAYQASAGQGDSAHVVVVKVAYFGLNRMDILQREGKYPLPPQAGEIMGVEFAGVVVSEVGEKEDGGVEVGDKVFGLAYGGAYAQYIANPAAMCCRVPEGLPIEVAASLPEVWFTAIQALYLVGGLEDGKGERVLVHAGASGVGLAAQYLARAAGCAKVYATAGSEKKLELCRQAGATRAINYRTEQYDEVILDDLGNTEGKDAIKGVDLILDFIGKDYWAKNIRVCARDARVVYLAFMSGNVVDKLDLAPLLLKRLRVQGTSLRSRTPQYQQHLRDLFLEKALPKIVSGEFVSHIDKIFDWEDIAEAQRRMQENAGDGGKIVCRVSHDD